MVGRVIGKTEITIASNMPPGTKCRTWITDDRNKTFCHGEGQVQTFYDGGDDHSNENKRFYPFQQKCGPFKKSGGNVCVKFEHFNIINWKFTHQPDPNIEWDKYLNCNPFVAKNRFQQGT
ncbi:hypothetical protein Glove_64g40 [Diversispora epigaea]|uniref:Uncharacterized protein n=1 Tax=Diversispora epigaea TaxID=1348612 RepID=A0A397JB65_9GLOM|nr:hypothetical protein Glove_64g40 [Diversispora epigaea]